ncbi:MAG: hemerythrin domain-containing protein [Actinomycetota bacterium]|nr:hemerythrin domain-containing protein [Actinomycetota bacterium]
MAGAFELLMQDHREVEQLFDQFAASGDRAVAIQICDELSIHATIEEEMIYPLLRSKVAADLADEARDEHTAASTIIARIYGMESDDGELEAAVEELRQIVDHHVQEEESEIFPQMEAILPETVPLLGNELADRKEALRALNTRVHGSVHDKPVPSGDPTGHQQQ